MADIMSTPAATPAAGTVTAGEEDDDQLGTLGRFQHTIDPTGIATFRRRKVDDPMATQHLDSPVSIPPTPQYPAALTNSSKATLRLGQTKQRATEPTSRAPTAMDYLDLKRAFSDLAVERDAHSDGALRQLAAQMVTRELNPDRAHCRQDGTLRDPLDEAKMTAALDEVVEQFHLPIDYFCIGS